MSGPQESASDTAGNLLYHPAAISGLEESFTHDQNIRSRSDHLGGVTFIDTAINFYLGAQPVLFKVLPSLRGPGDCFGDKLLTAEPRKNGHQQE
jgi:hypothetical protein